jgi:two-component system chemotaxis sensor kinase CheA
LDLAKYRTIFVEESTEHLSEISAALLQLEKDPGCADAIDSIFRMAHSIKGMAASMGYDAVTEVAHHLEDRMEAIRDAERAASGDELALLFHGLEALEAMVATVRATGEGPPANPELARALAEARPAEPAQVEKKKP